MRIMSLSEMLADLRGEARLSAAPAHAPHLRDAHAALLRRIQEDLILANDWPELDIAREVAVPAGQRFTSYPALVQHHNIQTAYVLDAQGKWCPLGYGITTEDYNQTNSAAGERGEPRLWQHYVDPDLDMDLSGQMFELWPVPVRDTQVRIEARREPDPLVDDADKSSLDGPMLVLFAAAELLAAQKAEDASLKLQKAQQRFDLIRRAQRRPDTRPIRTMRTAQAVADMRFRIG